MADEKSFTLSVVLHHDHGVAYAELHLTSPEDNVGRMIKVSSHGDHHNILEASREHSHHDYKSAGAALAAGLRRIADEIDFDWRRFAKEHGTGAV